ncbi:acyl-CoA synthetase (AMP-forming)/AMP-acid ligase II [Spongiibacter sp. IMCC21906]|uniref:acyl-CoA synthetase n=1 Tax=Spongiibacter sp. IMCC21906 TaxID=1620392 RepID=UPI00062DE17A|nr:long-chain fatty acid--CoA ligase [Spongiibacter sp. IMCC21906]AKH68577.1 acyl-CoA synthetase (AMP-forming)/AMP-acid ligase II [Spongiibacter sp. IMCC21906]
MTNVAQQSQTLDPSCLAEWFRRRAIRAPERPAVTFKNQTVSYGQMQAEIELLSGVFHEQGVKQGDRVGFLASNHPMNLIAQFAVARIGAILVPLNYRLATTELVAILKDADVSVLLVDPEHARKFDVKIRDVLGCQAYFCFGQECEGWLQLEPLMDRVSTLPPAADAAPDDAVALMYTSGTTGDAKGVMLSSRNIWTNNLNWILTSDFTSLDVTLNCAPLFHVGGLCVVLLPTLMSGGHLILQEAFDPQQYLDDIERYQVTVSFAVPAMMLFASQHSSFGTRDFSSMRLIVAGGAPVPEPLLKTYRQRGVPVSQCYGMTEATSGVAFLETERAETKLGSCGRAGPLNEVKLIDESGRTIDSPAVPGEICVRGGNVTPGYWRRPDLTAEALDAEGWYRTGDGAYFDDEGFYYICDRLKDMIISGGENIYPAEIESLLYAHPAIAEVAIIGREDVKWGERVLAVVVLKPDASLTLQEAVDFLEPSVARYKLPKELHLLDAMPRNSNGKILKTELRKIFSVT